MSSIDLMITQQVAAGRTMDCAFIRLAEQYKALYDEEKSEIQKTKIENDFRKALMLLPEYKVVHSKAILAYVFANPDSYTYAQRQLIVRDHVEYIIAQIPPEGKISSLAFLESLLPSEKRSGKMQEHAEIAALIRNKLDESK